MGSLLETRKKILAIGIILILIIVGLGGCNELTNDSESNSVTLSDGTVVTGDIGQIGINEFNFTKLRKVTWDRSHQTYRLTIDGYWYPAYSSAVPWGTGEAEAPYDLDVTNIDNDFDKKKELYLEYINPVEEDWELVKEQNVPIDYYSGYVTSMYQPTAGNFYYFFEVTEVDNFQLDNNIICDVKGTAKNIGNTFLDYPKITVNFYNSDGAWLAEQSFNDDDIPSGYTWDFEIRYDGEFSNDVRYIGFEVESNPYGI